MNSEGYKRANTFEDDSEIGAEIGRMIRENREWAVESLTRVGATIVIDTKNPDNITVTATREQLLAAKMEKPPHLYHGSSVGNIEEFEPRDAPERPTEKPLVYASPSIRVAEASMFNGDGHIIGGMLDGEYYVCIVEPREEFLKRDQRGYIYTFPSDTFKPNGGIGLGDQEWVADETVKPEAVTEIPSKLDRAIETGITVYFITHEQAKDIRDSQEKSDNPKELKEYLNRLESENERRDKGL